MTSNISTSRRSTAATVIAVLIVASSVSGNASAFSFPDLFFPENVPVPTARPDADADVTGSIPHTWKGVIEPGHSAASRARRAEDGRSSGLNRPSTSVKREAKR